MSCLTDYCMSIAVLGLFNSLMPDDAYMHQSSRSLLIQIMAWHRISITWTKSDNRIGQLGKNLSEILIKNTIIFMKSHCRNCLQNIKLCCTWVNVLIRSVTRKSLTHWGRVTHICIGNLTTISSDNGLSPGWLVAIIWINAEVLLIWTLGTNFCKILIEIHISSFTKMHWKIVKKMPDILSRPQCTNNWHKQMEQIAAHVMLNLDVQWNL